MMFFLLFLSNVQCKNALADPIPTPESYPLSASVYIMDIFQKIQTALLLIFLIQKLTNAGKLAGQIVVIQHLVIPSKESNF